MDEEIVVHRGSLTDDELDVLTGFLIVFLHAAERVMYIMEQHYETEYRASSEYKNLCKMYGKLLVDLRLKDTVKNMLRGDERSKAGLLLEYAKKFHTTMMSLTNSALTCHKGGVSDGEVFDSIMHDVNILLYIYCLMGNCPTDTDEVKLLSTLKILAKGNRVSQKLINIFKSQINA